MHSTRRRRKLRALLAAERFDGSIWEPACGQGRIAKVLQAKGHDVVATDLVDYGKVAMLVAVQSLCHPTRTPFFEKHPPAIIYAVDDCTCYPYGDPRKATRSILRQRYVWLVWHANHSGPTLFKWLAAALFKTRQKPLRATPPLLLRRAA